MATKREQKQFNRQALLGSKIENAINTELITKGTKIVGLGEVYSAMGNTFDFENKKVKLLLTNNVMNSFSKEFEIQEITIDNQAIFYITYTWHERFKAMKKAMGYNNADIASITGNTEDSIKSTTQPNKDLPRWGRLAIVMYERTLVNES